MPMPCGTRRSPIPFLAQERACQAADGAHYASLLLCLTCTSPFLHSLACTRVPALSYMHTRSCTLLHAHAHTAKRSRDHRSAPSLPPSPALHLQAPMDYGSGLKRTEDDTRTPDQRRIEMVDATADKFMAMCVLCEHDFVVAVFVVHTKACGRSLCCAHHGHMGSSIHGPCGRTPWSLREGGGACAKNPGTAVAVLDGGM